MIWITISIFVSLIGTLFSHPAPVPIWQYEPGVSYKYIYQFTILLNEDSNITSRSTSVGRHVGYKVSSSFLLTNIWQASTEKLLKLEVMQPKLHVSSTLHKETEHWSKLDNLSYPPIFIFWNEGIIKSIYFLPDTETESMINIKKGLAGFFQLRPTKEDTKELDVSGSCNVRYKADGKNVKKIKYGCERTSSRFQATDPYKLRSSSVSTSSESFYTLLPDGVIKSVTGTEKIMIKLNAWTQAAVFVKSKTKMNLVDQHPSNQQFIKADTLDDALITISKEMGAKLKEDSIEVFPDTTGPCTGNCSPLNVLVNENAEHLLPNQLAKIKSASGYLKLLDGFRRASKKELLVMFRDAKEYLLPQLMDILAATQTEDSLDVAFALIDFESDDITLPERFLLCLATVPYPTEAVLYRTLKLTQKKIKNEKLYTTILITLSSLLRSYCLNNGEKVNKKIVNATVDVLLTNPKCTNPQCILIQLYAMRNAGHPSFIPFLMKYSSFGGNVGLLALQGLKNIDTKYYTDDVIKHLQRIFNDFWPRQDVATRVLAAELLIRARPNFENIGQILMSLSVGGQNEFTTLVLATLKDTALKNPAVRSGFEQVMNNITIGNYNNLAQNGSSAVYTKLFHAAHDINITYGLNIELRKTGMLKRTSMDLGLSNEQGQFPLLSLGLLVNGFGLTEEEQKATEVPEEHSAGMELSVLGVQLRPYTFFTGTGELMGLVWSGIGSDPTPALQANFLIMDEKKSLVLQNGIVVDFNLKAALSTDVSGTIEVSVWNKNAHAAVKNAAALLILGSCKIDTSFVESRVDFALGGNAILDMSVNLDYSNSPMQMCLQMDQKEFNFRHNVRKTETIPGSKHLIRTLKRRQIHFPGRSLPLHMKNYDSCRELLYPKPKASYW